MKTATKRKIVKIDESKCDGCGLCVPACAEGAIQIVDGKARLVADRLCDGIGDCLGQCPRGAITIEERPAEAFDETVVHSDKASPSSPSNMPQAEATHQHNGGGCPGSMFRKLAPTAAAPTDTMPAGRAGSRLAHWPVQLALVPENGPIWQHTDVLLAADCVPFAMSDFHESLLAGKTLAIGCPKLDDPMAYVEKLARIFAANDIASITVAHMEVPCCFGLSKIVHDAIGLANRLDIPVKDITISIEGQIKG